MGSRLDLPPQSPESSSAQLPSRSADYQALAQENERLKEYLGQYENQIKEMENDLKHLR